MTQHDRHATTEQLSAFLDGQLSTQDQPQIEAHLKTCEQCQLQLAGLRQTVALLHALPQPQLPRSFVLSEEMLAGATTDTLAETPTDTPAGTPAGTPESTTKEGETLTKERFTVLQSRTAPSPSSSRKHQNGAWSSPLRGTISVVSTLAAVLGIVLLLSGLLSSLLPVQKATPTSMSMPAASSGAAATPATAPKAQSSSSSEKATATATSQAQSSYGAAQKDKAPATPTQPAETAKPFALPAFLNPVISAGQVFWGLCLLIASIIGALLLRQQRKKLEQAP